MVNVTNMEVEDNFDQNRFIQEIFDQQKKLLIKYKEIENLNINENGSLNNLQTYENQAIIKDFAWRTIEEIGESLEAKDHKNRIHQLEELADGLHFITELCILSGINYVPYESNLIKDLPQLALYEFIRDLGVCMNFLKAKRWKRTLVYSDEKEYLKALVKAYQSYLNYCESEGFSLKDIYLFYLKKNKVNQFRIKTNY